MNTDNFPLEHLELWHNAPSDAATLFDTMDFIERPSEYADEKYAGAYVFAHAFKQNKKCGQQPMQVYSTVNFSPSSTCGYNSAARP